MVKVIASERLSERTVEQIGDVPAPKVMKDSVEMTQAVPKEQTQEHIFEETNEGNAGASRANSRVHGGRNQQRPLVASEGGNERSRDAHSHNRAVRNPTVEQIVSLLIAQIQEELVEVIQPQLRGQFTNKAMDTPVPQERQMPTVQTIQETVKN